MTPKCRFFQQGNCNKGEMCAFMHCDPQGSPAVSPRGTRESTKEKAPPGSTPQGSPRDSPGNSPRGGSKSTQYSVGNKKEAGVAMTDVSSYSCRKAALEDNKNSLFH